ncbi:MAG TPA: HDOD domain-containing protein [Candidatus Competibacteraceae bacterium]|nr:HDOD domain-containing protein [Candidatus Competibacteraceae bacterium]
MKEIYLGRQPIYDPNLHVEGYQLSYHPTEAGELFEEATLLSAEMKHTQVLFDTLTEVGLERLAGENKIFLNVVHVLLVQGTLRQLIEASPRLVFEVMANISVDEPLIAALKALRQKGYCFLLDGYVDNEAYQALLETVEYVRLNISTTPEPEARRLLTRFHQRGLAVIASGIEDQHQLEVCQKLGFNFFQGRHFSQPRLLKFQGIQTNQLAVVRLVSALNQSDADLQQIASLIAQDVALSYKLLRYINSAYFSLPQRVESIQRAVALLGLRTVRSWATLISMSGVESARSDLMTIALVRAKMCELLGEQLGLKQLDSNFMVGLLSVLDLVAQAPMSEVLAALPLEDDINAALLHHEGALGQILACTLAYEQCDWATLKESGLDAEQVNEAYMAALADTYRASYELLRD